MDITKHITSCVLTKTPVSFSKYGDGEYSCIRGSNSQNCDNDRYTDKLSQFLSNSLKYVTGETDNSFIGLWPDAKIKEYYQSLVSKPIKWADYHTIIITNEDIKENTDKLRNKIELYKTIKQSPLKKIIISNELLIRAKTLLNLTQVIHVPFCNWFDNQFEELINILTCTILNHEPFILITCCGMSAKAIIGVISKHFPHGIFLDFGSALDLICTKHDSRGWDYKYDDLVHVFKDLLPDDWEHEKYNNIFEKAKIMTGIHLPK
jgi:hypothetical protein